MRRLVVPLTEWVVDVGAQSLDSLPQPRVLGLQVGGSPTGTVTLGRQPLLHVHQTLRETLSHALHAVGRSASDM
jgi:hypothetical protein